MPSFGPAVYTHRNFRGEHLAGSVKIIHTVSCAEPKVKLSVAVGGADCFSPPAAHSSGEHVDSNRITHQPDEHRSSRKRKSIPFLNQNKKSIANRGGGTSLRRALILAPLILGEPQLTINPPARKSAFLARI